MTNKAEVIRRATLEGKTVQCVTSMDLCHLKNSELETKFQKYKGRVVLKSDIVKDDSGIYAVFTEQGASASHVTSAKVLDVIPRLPGCSGQASDAASAYTQVTMKDATELLHLSEEDDPKIWIRTPKARKKTTALGLN